MEPDRMLSFCPIEHTNARVRRFGYDPTDEYVEQCWSATIGPSSTLLLRLLPSLWVAHVPAEIAATELSRALGLGAATGAHSHLERTLARPVRFGLARPAVTGAGLGVYDKVPPLAPRQLERRPQWTRDAHDRLHGAHIEQVTRGSDDPPQVAPMSARLDRVQERAARTNRNPAPRGQGLGR